MTLDQMARREGTAEAEFAREHTRRDDARQPTRVVSRAGRVRTAHAEQIEHGALRLKDRAASDGPDLDGRHRHADLEIAMIAGQS
jgi:hypothetical protein